MKSNGNNNNNNRNPHHTHVVQSKTHRESETNKKTAKIIINKANEASKSFLNGFCEECALSSSFSRIVSANLQLIV